MTTSTTPSLYVRRQFADLVFAAPAPTFLAFTPAQLAQALNPQALGEGRLLAITTPVDINPLEGSAANAVRLFLVVSIDNDDPVPPAPAARLCYIEIPASLTIVPHAVAWDNSGTDGNIPYHTPN